MNNKLLEHIFGAGHCLSYKQVYPHGFIDKKAVLPADFCELGVEQFQKDLELYSFFRNDIINSLHDKFAELGNADLVLPRSLQNWLRW
jgi:hypothetical protein